MRNGVSFCKNHFLIGLSVDGIKATHDLYRKDAVGKDTYFRVLESAKLLEAAGVEFNVLMVVNGKTAPKIRRIYENFRKLGFSWQQYIACLDPISEHQGQEEYSLSPEMYGRFLIELFELWDLDLRQGKQPYIRQFENYVGILLGQFPESCEQRGVCSFQNIVEADGSVYPCDFYVLDEYRIGNLNEDSFETIHERRLKQGFVEASCNHTEECRACPYFMICRGGCRRHRSSREADREKITSASPIGCFLMHACRDCRRSRQRSARRGVCVTHPSQIVTVTRAIRKSASSTLSAASQLIFAHKVEFPLRTFL